MPYIETRDRTRLYVKDWGTGRPVILLHGWPLSADSWDDQAMVLAQSGFRVIAYDRRGFGRSDQPWSGYDYDTLSDDLSDVIEQTGARDAAIIGFSMGGGEVARYLSRHEGRNVVQAGLIASVVPYLLRTDDNPHGVREEVFAQMRDGIRRDRAHFWSGFFKSFYGVGLLSHPVSDELLKWSGDVAMMAGLNATLECVNAFSRTDFRPDLPAFKVPTLIIHGTADATVPIEITGRAAAGFIRQSALVEYDAAPHGLLATHKDQVAENLLTFLRE